MFLDVFRTAWPKGKFDLHFGKDPEFSETHPGGGLHSMSAFYFQAPNEVFDQL